MRTMSIKISIRVIIYTLAFSFMMGQISCKKYLDEKRSQNQEVPSSLTALQAVLDNQNGNSRAPDWSEFLTDNNYLTPSTWNFASSNERGVYTWNPNEYLNPNNWTDPYFAIYEANFVLDFLPQIDIDGSEQAWANEIKGAALFYRSFMYYELAQLYCRPYSNTAATDPGIVLRFTAQVQTPSIRASVKETYDQIIADSKIAADLLPVTTVVTMRPSRAAAYGFLARVYLSMRDYVNADLYANKALTLNSAILDFNTLNLSGNPILPPFKNNPEILFLSYAYYGPLLDPSFHAVDTGLYKSYDANDLRKDVFFGTNGTAHYWLGSYFPDNLRHSIFNGIATDEMYLIRAECRARAGSYQLALDDLNALLRKRWKDGLFTPITALNATDALNKILAERRKELTFRNLRWTDLRRFNLEGADITLQRIINGTPFTLPPNDLRWVALIPIQEIGLSGISQNPR